MQLLPSVRIAIALVSATVLSTALAWCPAPDASTEWRFVGEVIQNRRVTSSRTFNVTGWRTVASSANTGASPRNATLTAKYDENVSVSASIARWGLGASTKTTWTHDFDVTVPARSRVRLLHRRREEVREMVWDVMCAWRHRTTGQARLTTYGRNYRGTTWRLYDTYELRTEPI